MLVNAAENKRFCAARIFKILNLCCNAVYAFTKGIVHHWIEDTDADLPFFFSRPFSHSTGNVLMANLAEKRRVNLLFNIALLLNSVAQGGKQADEHNTQESKSRAC